MYLGTKKHIKYKKNDLKIIKKTTKNMNLKFNINIKATTSGEHQKSWVSNLLGSIK